MDVSFRHILLEIQEITHTPLLLDVCTVIPVTSQQSAYLKLLPYHHHLLRRLLGVRAGTNTPSDEYDTYRDTG